MTRADEVTRLATYIMDNDPSFKGFTGFEYQFHRLDLEDKIHRAVEAWIDDNVRESA